MKVSQEKRITQIETDIKTIKDNHLAHIEKDMSKLDKRIEKMDMRLWWVLGIMVASTVIAYIGDKL